jgi:hypothetical protein
MPRIRSGVPMGGGLTAYTHHRHPPARRRGVGGRLPAHAGSPHTLAERHVIVVCCRDAVRPAPCGRRPEVVGTMRTLSGRLGRCLRGVREDLRVSPGPASGGEAEHRPDQGQSAEGEGDDRGDIGDLGDLPPAVGVEQRPMRGWGLPSRFAFTRWQIARRTSSRAARLLGSIAAMMPASPAAAARTRSCTTGITTWVIPVRM